VRSSSAGGTRVCSRLRFAVVLVVGELRIVRGLLTCSYLCGHGSCVVLMHRGNFRRTRLDVDAAVASVVADAVGGLRAVMDIVHDDITLIVVANAGADVGDRAVVVEVVALPVAAEEAEAYIAEAVVDAAIVADVRSPISAMEAIVRAAIAPIRRCPESTVIGWRNPLAGNPVVAVIAPSPIAGSPEVVGIGSGGLVVFRQRRRSLF